MEWNVVEERIFLELNIPPLLDSCMSSCNYSMNSETSARTSNPLLLLCLVVKGIMGFLMTNLNLKLVSALINFFFLFFNFSLAFSTLSIYRDRVEFILVFSLTCSLRISFSVLICLLSTSNSYLSLLSTSISDSGGLGVLSLLSEAFLSNVST